MPRKRDENCAIAGNVPSRTSSIILSKCLVHSFSSSLIVFSSSDAVVCFALSRKWPYASSRYLRSSPCAGKYDGLGGTCFDTIFFALPCQVLRRSYGDGYCFLFGLAIGFLYALWCYLLCSGWILDLVELALRHRGRSVFCDGKLPALHAYCKPSWLVDTWDRIESGFELQVRAVRGSDMLILICSCDHVWIPKVAGRSGSNVFSLRASSRPRCSPQHCLVWYHASGSTACCSWSGAAVPGQASAPVHALLLHSAFQRLIQVSRNLQVDHRLLLPLGFLSPGLQVQIYRISHRSPRTPTPHAFPGFVVGSSIVGFCRADLRSLSVPTPLDGRWAS